MNNFPIVLLAMIMAAVTSLLTLFFFGSGSQAADLQPGEAGISEDLEFRIAELERSLLDMNARGTVVDAGGRQQVGAVDELMTRDAVRAWMDEHAAEFRLQPVEELAKGPVDMGNLLRRLSNPDLSEAESHEIWKDAAEAGLMEELLESYKLAVEQNPGSANAQVELGGAYLQALQHEKNPMKQGEMSFAADAAFDSALEIDDHNWDARFLKGLALSFWPDFLGKQGESIQQFEILIEQQESAGSDPKHAQSYVYLGNLYASRGEQDKAQAMFNRGFARFPESTDLKSKAR